MENNEVKTRVCPICGKTYTGNPEISGVDNKTAICPECKAKEALRELDVPEDEKQVILGNIDEQFEME